MKTYLPRRESSNRKEFFRPSIIPRQPTKTQRKATTRTSGAIVIWTLPSPRENHDKDSSSQEKILAFSEERVTAETVCAIRNKNSDIFRRANGHNRL